MSAHQVVATMRALLQDPVVGLRAKAMALADQLQPVGAVRFEFNFTRWAFGRQMNPATMGNVMLRPSSWRGDEKLATQQRDAQCTIEIGYEMFATDPDEIEDNVTIIAAAIAQCAVDELRAYSDAHGGTIVDVIDPIEVQFGEFAGVPGSATSNGFLARITVFERSSV